MIPTETNISKANIGNTGGGKKITFVVASGFDNKTHLIQHNTNNVTRPKFASNRKVNVEREWDRYVAQRPDVIELLSNAEANPYDNDLSLVGAIDGAVTWFDGEEVEPWEKEVNDAEKPQVPASS